jgi:sucrose synthase
MKLLPRAETLLGILQDILTEDDGLLLHQEIAARTSSAADETGAAVVDFLRHTQEVFALDGNVLFFYRPGVSDHLYLRLDGSRKTLKRIAVSEYLGWKERLIPGIEPDDTSKCIDFSPFRFAECISGPSKVARPSGLGNSSKVAGLSAIGRGVSALMSCTAASLFRERVLWTGLLEMMKGHGVEGVSLLLNDAAPSDRDALVRKIDDALNLLQSKSGSISCTEIMPGLRRSGFDPGWGRNAGEIGETLTLLRNALLHPDEASLEALLGRLPLISRVAILSPHGWFGQKNVLGKPDTGGQVIYILDQVRGLEQELAGQLEAGGLCFRPKIVVLTRLIPKAGNTSCDRRLEKIDGTVNGWILRVPFRDEDGNRVEDWISRFHLWPYLDRFIRDGEAELREELPGGPDLIIGNYSDGNIAAARLAEAFDAPLCTIAHALEKTKYLKSDLFWNELDEEYHFSIHFIADTLSMEKSDFIITSTLQEIAGTEEAIGQYESYQAFTLPGYCRIVSGSDIRHWKYNINPPGVDERNYFPYHRRDSRDGKKTAELRRLLYEEESGGFGSLDDAAKPPIFAMSRLDRIKNISGLVDAYGRSGPLRETANLIVAGGTTLPEESGDAEERREIETLYRLIADHDLEGSLRWLPSIEKSETGEVYRIIADGRGIFVQPALFEGFGLTVLEAMVSGVPTFATRYGGPSEIIEDGKSGFLIDPHDPDALASVIEGFMLKASKNPDLWRQCSDAGIARVLEHFTWPLYCQRLSTMAKAYGLWRCISDQEHAPQRTTYWDDLYSSLIRERARNTFFG